MHFGEKFRTALILLIASFVPAVAANYYASPTGSAGGDGSIANPWNLQTALSQPASVRPGDTIWLRGGTYYGPFNSTLTGTVSAPIIVRQYPGERAIVDGPASSPTGAILNVNGAATWYWGFEVICSDTNRYISRATGVIVYGPNTRFINLIVHDTGQGFGFWQPALDSTLYGNIIYNNGFEGPDRGHGHSIYTQNQTSTKHILDNIFFQSFSVGLHAYSQSGYLNNFDVEGNIAFNHGVVSAAGAKHNLLIGGGPVAQNPTLLNNFTYFPTWATSGRNEIGYGSGCNNLTMTGNYYSQPSALILNCTNVTMTGNTLAGAISGFTPSQYPANTYISGRPTGTVVSVRPNQYEPGRANIVVYNWDNLPAVNVDVSGVLKVGDAFEVRDAQNYFGPAVLSGTYSGGTISLPTALTQISATVGAFPVPPTHTASEFNAYVLLPRSSGGGGVNQPPSVIAGPNQTITLPASAVLSGSVSDDGLPNHVLNIAWSKVSGPGTVTFNPANTASSVASFSTAGTYVLQLWASDGALSASSQLTVVVNAQAVSTGAAQFVKTDTTTSGNWRTLYGSEGAAVINDQTVLPSYAQLTPSGQNSYTWAASTTDARALSRYTTGRIAATWYTSGTMSLDVNQNDGKTHQFAIYCLDWDGGGSRAERIDVLDAGTGAVLDSRTVSSFANGQYLVWNVTGHVIVKVTRTGGSNAVISGIFWGAGSGGITPPPPPPVPPPAPGSTAQFVTADTATQGSWSGVYGASGRIIVNDSTTAPPAVTITPARQIAYTWAPSTPDRRALAKSTGTDRIAATWFSPSSFDLDVAITDGSTRRLALYCLDWDGANSRGQRVDILDATTGAVLDTRSLSSFSNGTYLVWKVSGHVIARFTRLQGSNAVMSGLFID